jgi:hypothetical protein
VGEQSDHAVLVVLKIKTKDFHFRAMSLLHSANTIDTFHQAIFSFHHLRKWTTIESYSLISTSIGSVSGLNELCKLLKPNVATFE